MTIIISFCPNTESFFAICLALSHLKNNFLWLQVFLHLFLPFSAKYKLSLYPCVLAFHSLPRPHKVRLPLGSTIRHHAAVLLSSSGAPLPLSGLWGSSSSMLPETVLTCLLDTTLSGFPPISLAPFLRGSSVFCPCPTQYGDTRWTLDSAQVSYTVSTGVSQVHDLSYTHRMLKPQTSISIPDF